MNTDNLLEAMDEVGRKYNFIQADNIEYDEQTRGINFTVRFKVSDVIKRHKLGRKMRALTLFIGDRQKSRKISVKTNDTVLCVRTPNFNDGWRYFINEDFDYLYDDIFSNARSPKHQQLLAGQLDELRLLIDQDVQDAGMEARQIIERDMSFAPIKVGG